MTSTTITKTEKKFILSMRDWIKELIVGGGEDEGEKEKKVKSAYLYFCDAKRSEAVATLLAANPEASVIRSADVLVELGKVWKMMSDDDKKIYVEMSSSEKERRKAATPREAAAAVTEETK